MKQAQNAQKRRGRPSSRNNGKSQNSNRNEPKVRGNPKQLAEKYKNQAREALQSGDRTQAEYYFQFADHYHRVLNEMRGPNNQTTNQNNTEQAQDDGDNGGQQNRRRNNRRNQRGRSSHENSAQQENGVQNASEEQSAQLPDANEVQENAEVSEKPAPKRRRSAPKSEVSVGEDVAAQEQPKEVHPELDLNGEAPAKPVRRRAPARRKREDKADAGTAAVVPKPSTGDEAA